MKIVITITNSRNMKKAIYSPLFPGEVLRIPAKGTVDFETDEKTSYAIVNSLNGKDGITAEVRKSETAASVPAKSRKNQKKTVPDDDENKTQANADNPADAGNGEV